MKNEPIPLTDACVYTIISPDTLLQAVDEHKALPEKKRWASADRYFKQARADGLKLPIVFADARKCTKLIAWSTLDKLVVNGSTKFTVTHLYSVGSAKRKSLSVLSTGAPIPLGHVRPYVICKTPKFLLALAKRPKALSESSKSNDARGTPRYWVVKGRPSENDFEGWLKPGTRGRWRTGRPPKYWAKGDHLFFWRMSPELDIVGLGEFAGVSDTAPNEETVFRVKYLGPILSVPIGIAQLRRDRLLRAASFLKSGPAGTVFPLTSRQGKRLYQLICRRNPSALDVWSDLREAGGSNDAILDIDTMDIAATEGRRRLVSHLRLERSRQLIEAKKRAVLRARGTLACEVCEFDFLQFYGALGKGYCEVHHRKLLAKADGQRITRLEDLAIVCSNCHRMLHHSSRVLSIERLRRLLTEALPYRISRAGVN